MSDKAIVGEITAAENLPDGRVKVRIRTDAGFEYELIHGKPKWKAVVKAGEHHGRDWHDDGWVTIEAATREEVDEIIHNLVDHYFHYVVPWDVDVVTPWLPREEYARVRMSREYVVESDRLVARQYLHFDDGEEIIVRLMRSWAVGEDEGESQ